MLFRPGCWSVLHPAHPRRPTARLAHAVSVGLNAKRNPAVHGNDRSARRSEHTTCATRSVGGALALGYKRCNSLSAGATSGQLGPTVSRSHGCFYLKALAEACFGTAPRGRAWAQQRRTPLQTKSDSITWVLPSATALCGGSTDGGEAQGR
jgi:hypothetical protein